MHLRIFSFLAALAVPALPALSCANDSVAEPGSQTPPLSETPVIGGDGASGTITVMPGMTYQTMDGFGTSQRMWDDPHLNGSTSPSTGGIVINAVQRDTIYDLLYSPTRGIGLNRLRVHLIEPGWQTEPGAPIVTDGPYPGPQGSAQIDFIAKALLRNPELRTGFQVGRFDAWVDKETEPETVAAYLKTGLDYAKTKGHEPDWIGIHNEPSYGPPGFSGEKLRDIIRSLKTLLDADGRYSAKVSAPDDVVDQLGTEKAATILADSTARSFLKALSIHLYGDLSPTGMRDLSARHGVPLWMTEYDSRSDRGDVGWASTIVHEMIVTYNCSAVDMLFGFFGSRGNGTPEATYITLNSNGTTYTGYTLNPSYYQMGHWSRYVTRGSVRMGAASTNPDVKVSAFMKGEKKVIVLIHTGDGSASVTIPAGSYRLIRTQMSGADRLTYKGVFTSAVTLPRSSITTLVER